VNYGKTYFTGAFPEIWLFFLGGLFVVSTLFLPKGVVGLVKNRFIKGEKVGSAKEEGLVETDDSASTKEVSS